MAEVASSSTTTGTPTNWMRRSRRLIIQNSRNWLMAWEAAAKAYQELLMDICWFEPLRLRRRLAESKASPSIVEEIEAKLRDAVCRQRWALDVYWLKYLGCDQILLWAVTYMVGLLVGYFFISYLLR
ncbi:hypothetical protein HanXRQr2_Chr09g0383601 [Helianthus annuus]|uniref:Uncharacterized protein n=1 Tax=Helianthus annuus TaxID=4232 RepID=A0A9K3I551_HELAN|nr:hypothetical protein HanXRQr2_Chr09g0383601 [Helianthus annuus]